MFSSIKHRILGLVAVLAMGVVLAPAASAHGWHHHGYGWHNSRVAETLGLGLVIGAIADSVSPPMATPYPYYGEVYPQYGYTVPQPYYYGYQSPVVVPPCYYGCRPPVVVYGRGYGYYGGYYHSGGYHYHRERGHYYGHHH